MNYVERLEHWGDEHHPKWVDLIRIALGVFLFTKGIEFANNTSTVSALLADEAPFSSFIIVILAHYLIFAHIAGGFLLVVGLLTRLACIIQIPVVLGAIIFVNWEVMKPFSMFLLSLMILLLLIYFMVIGSGPWSLDRALFGKNDEDVR